MPKDDNAKKLLTSMFANPDAVARIAEQTARLMSGPILLNIAKMDQTTFAMAFAALQQFDRTSLRPKREEEKTEETRKEMRAVLSDLDRRYGSDVTSHYGAVLFSGLLLFEEMYADNDFTRWEKFLHSAYENARNQSEGRTIQPEIAVSALKELLDLTQIEADLMLFQILRSDFSFARLFERLFSANHRNVDIAKYFLAELLNVSTVEIDDALSKDSVLIKSSLINYTELTGRLSPLSDSMINWFLSTPGSAEFLLKVTTPLTGKVSKSGAVGSLAAIDRTLIIDLLTKAQGEEAVNVLAYGPTQLDKKTAIFNMLEGSKFTGHLLNTKGISASDQASRTYIAQRMLSKLKAEGPQILVVEDAETVLSRRNSGFMAMFGMTNRDEEDGAEHLETDEVLIEQNPTATIWLVSRPRNMIEENVGRFLFHCEIKPGSRADRRREIETIVKDLNLSDELQTYLSKYQMLSKNQVQSAARLAQLVASPNDPAEIELYLKRGVQQSQKALQRDFMEELRESVTAYSLDYINTASAFTPAQVLNALKKRPKGTICLYGIPGSGKTQFAEYLAVELDKPLLKKRASDLLDKYVGENEKNIANMFREAAEDEAILFLDEADSFLRDRSMARAEWSVTQVNELLQQMERFPGIFIVATNLFKDIDAAALRRFTFKFEFLALTEVQRWKMFETETNLHKYIEADRANPEGEIEDAELYIEDIKKRVNAIQNLTPGDFATVKRQSDILGEILAPEDWINQLAEEAKAKLLGLQRNGMGFTAS